ncbi:MAG TPA: efflux RND transporter periplasmic adaptor subunit [Gallionellaceae bacterium]
MPVPQLIQRMLSRKVAIAAGVIVLAAVTIGFATRTPPVEAVLTTVARGTVEATVNNTRAGTVKACRRAKMAPSAGGKISQLLVKKGQRVEKGQVLLRLWSEDLQAQDRLAQEQLKTAQTQMQQACIQADLAEKEAVRAHQLRTQGFISPEGLDQKDSAAKVARAGCESARSQIDQGRARIEAARAELERMTLRAPFAGVVADISGELGEFSTPSPPGIPTLPAIDLIDNSCMYVSAPIDEVDASHVRVGQTARITLDAIKGKVFPGKVRRIAPYVMEIEKQARTVEVEVEFAAIPDNVNLLIGYSADVEIVYDKRDNVLRIPTQTLLEGKKVLYYRNDGMLEERTVQTGLANWDQTEITGGLSEGDRIVLSLDRPGVKAGAKVKPAP